MRLFIAVNLSGEIKTTLKSAQNTMFGCGIRGNFTPVENMHLTLAFIGEYPDAKPVLDALSTVTFTPFDIVIEGMGCFHDLWWAGIKESVPLTSVARRVRKAFAQSGIPFDRRCFSPHITLIRKASGKMPGIHLPPVTMTVSTISLMRSDRGKKGMIYTELGVREV